MTCRHRAFAGIPKPASRHRQGIASPSLTSLHDPSPHLGRRPARRMGHHGIVEGKQRCRDQHGPDEEGVEQDAEGNGDSHCSDLDGLLPGEHGECPGEHDAAVLPWRDYASHAGSRGRCPPPARAFRSGVVIGCVHRDASCDLRCPATPITYQSDINLIGTLSRTAAARGRPGGVEQTHRKDQDAAIGEGRTAIRRAISGPLTPVTSGLSRSLADTPPRRSGRVTGPDGTDSQADSAGSIPVTRSTQTPGRLRLSEPLVSSSGPNGPLGH